MKEIKALLELQKDLREILPNLSEKEIESICNKLYNKGYRKNHKPELIANNLIYEELGILGY